MEDLQLISDHCSGCYFITFRLQRVTGVSIKFYNSKGKLLRDYRWNKVNGAFSAHLGMAEIKDRYNILQIHAAGKVRHHLLVRMKGDAVKPGFN